MIRPTDAAILKMITGVLLRQYRLDLKLKLTEFSKELPFHNSKLSQIEFGYKVVKKEDLELVLKHYNVSLEDFCKRVESFYLDNREAIIDLRYKAQWLSLQKCVAQVFKERLREGYSIHAEIENL